MPLIGGCGIVVDVEERQVLAGRYRLEDALGSGGMSEVWRAFDLVLNRSVAVKVLSSTYAHNDHFREAIRTEAQTAAKVSHPNLASVYDYGESVDDAGDPVPYVVMELLTGPTLAQRLAERPVPHRTALRICAEIADGLATAHDHGLVHRDVKPGNIVLTGTGAKLVDFGVATTAGAPEAAGPNGDIMGTPSYVAPERLLAGNAISASDVYSLGVVLFRTLTGELPWPAGLPTVATRTHPAPLPHLDGVPAPVADLYLCSVDMDPGRRPTARQVATTLAASVAIRPISANADDESGASPAILPAAAAALPAEAFDRTGDTGLRRSRATPIFMTVAAAAVAGIIALGNMNGSGIGLRPPGTGPAAPTIGAPQLTNGPSNPTDNQSAPTDGPPAGVPAATGAWPPGTGPPWPTATSAGGPTTATTTGTSQPPQPTINQPATRTFTSPGGSTVATCSGGLAYLDSWSPASGYSVPQPPRRGPDTTVSITFRKRNSDSTITVWCADGQPDGQVSTVHTTKTPKGPQDPVAGNNQHAAAHPPSAAAAKPVPPGRPGKARGRRT